jgi:hypothetical protein
MEPKAEMWGRAVPSPQSAGGRRRHARENAAIESIRRLPIGLQPRSIAAPLPM